MRPPRARSPFSSRRGARGIFGRGVGACVLLAGLLASPPRAGAAVEVRAAFDRSRITAGESTTLEVVVSGVSGGIAEPTFDLPAGVELLGTARAQNFSFVNGRTSLETVFRYELSAGPAGAYAIGPVRVRVGGKLYEIPPVALAVESSAPQLGAGRSREVPRGTPPASLEVDVQPRDPWVGQPIALRVRLVQRQALAEDPQYQPPSTSGFWAEPPSRPESYYADEGGRRVLVTETRARLHPLAAGVATIGPALAELTLASGGAFDPFAWPVSGRRRFEVRSQPVQVRVRPLPDGAPPGFDGAVGGFRLSWSADRNHTAQDVPVTVELDLRGVGNLPMIHTPPLESDDFEVFGGPVDDSLSVAGSDAPSRRSFRWTLLPRRTGRVEIPPPSFAWFDPGAGIYRRAQLPALAIEVTAPLVAGGGGGEGFPAVFLEHPVDPFARRARPLAWAIAGLLAGAAAALWREAARKPGDTAERARQSEYLRAARLSGPDFWRAAAEAVTWLESTGSPVAELRRDIAAARYSASRADPEALRERLVETLKRALPPSRGAVPLRVLAVVAALLGCLAVALGAPRWGTARAALAARAADERAQGGDVTGARAAWLALWQEGARAPGLAARLAWAEQRGGSIAGAALWVLRGQRGDARDPALAWTWERVRESGGLTGAARARWPIRSVEWAAAALLLGVLAGLAYRPGGGRPERARVALLAGLALAVTAIGPLEDWRAQRLAQAVVRSGVPLEGAGLELSPGQVVRVRTREAGRVRVSAGRDIAGWVPSSALEVVD